MTVFSQALLHNPPMGPNLIISGLWNRQTDRQQENVWSPIESEQELHVCIYLPRVNFKGHQKGPNWMYTGPKNHSRIKSPLQDDKENVLSSMESKTEPQVHIYSRVGDHASTPTECQVKGKARPQN